MKHGRKLGIAAAAVLTGALLHDCYTPPVILEGGRKQLSLAQFPLGAEAVAIEAAPGVTLRGVFVPAGPGAPVVLCLLESMGSITYGSRPAGRITVVSDEGATPFDMIGFSELEPADGYPPQRKPLPDRFQYQLLARLQALGLSSLVVDYEGVGGSDGERSPDHLRRDARAAWDEALRRADGDGGRVLLRGVSIGTLAAASLLQDGARPAAVTLIAPVRAETVAPNFGRIRYGEVATALLRWFVRDALDVDLLAQLSAMDIPLLVIAPQKDALLPADEQDQVRAAVERAHGTFLIRERDHDVLAGAARDLLPAEAAFLERHVAALLPDRESAAVAYWEKVGGRAGWRDVAPDAFDTGRPLRTRLHALISGFAVPGPGLPIALALADLADEELSLLAFWSAWLPRELGWAPDLDALAALVSLQDPAGRLDVQVLLEALPLASCLSGRSPEAVRARYAQTYDPAVRYGGGVSVAVGTGDVEFHGLDSLLNQQFDGLRRRLSADRGLSEEDADRQALRLFLRSASIPERLDATGTLEVWHEGRWRPLRPDPVPPGAAPAAAR